MKCNPNCTEGSHSSNTYCTCFDERFKKHDPHKDLNGFGKCVWCRLPIKPSTEKYDEAIKEWKQFATDPMNQVGHSPEKKEDELKRLNSFEGFLQNKLKEEPRAEWEEFRSLIVGQANLTGGQAEIIESFISRLITQAREEVLMDVIHSFGEYWPIGGKDVDDLPKLAKEITEGFKEIGREEERTKIREMVEALDYDKYINTHDWLGMDGNDGYEKAKDDILTALQAGDNQKGV